MASIPVLVAIGLIAVLLALMAAQARRPRGWFGRRVMAGALNQGNKSLLDAALRRGSRLRASGSWTWASAAATCSSAPSIPLIVPKDKVGTAFGLTTMIQNVGLAVFPFLNGKLRELTSSYTASMVMFAGLGLAGLAFAILLKRADAREGGVLERSTT